MGNDGDAWLKLRDVAGYVINRSIIWMKTDDTFLDQHIQNQE